MRRALCSVWATEGLNRARISNSVCFASESRGLRALFVSFVAFETQFTLCTSPAFRSSAVLTPPISQRPSLTGVYRGLIIVIVAGKEPLITHHLRVCEFRDFFSYCTSRMWSPSENFLFFPTNPRHPLPSTYPILCNGRSLDWLFNSPTTEIPHSSPLSQCDGDRKLLIRIKIQLRHLFKISHLFGVFSPISG